MRYSILFLIVLTLIFGLFFIKEISDIKKETKNLVLEKARTNFNKDMAIRYWATLHGGIYVEIDSITQPNPYLKVEEREITTPSGKKLTLMNPAYMVRQMNEYFSDNFGEIGHITSLNLTRPENKPDEWESIALIRFQNGVKEVSEFTTINDEPYFRLMKPMVTVEGCLKCHGEQGYKVGDVRGGRSVSIPMKSYLEDEKDKIKNFILYYGSVYFAVILLVSVLISIKHK